MAVRKRIWIPAATIMAVLGLLSVASIMAWRSSGEQQKVLQPLKDTAVSFAVPVGAVKAFPDSSSSSPPRVDRGWKMASDVEHACSNWGNVFREWIANQQPPGFVTGEAVPGQSCTFSGTRNGFEVRLAINKFGIEPTQATLSVIGK